MGQFESAIIEISGKCNACCKWCVTGRDNRYGIRGVKTCLSFRQFKEIYEHLMRLKAVDKRKDIMLYSWGEPFLNQEAMEIFSFLSENEQSYSISTNGSIYREALNNRTYKYMSSVTFSMSGFSQASYNKIHKFDFDQICKNIGKLLTNMRKNGFTGNAIIVFHVYQFNTQEVEEASKFAKRLGASFVPYYAYFNGLSLAKKYVNKTFSDKEQSEMESEICLHYVEQRRNEIPADFKCPLRKILTIDEKGRLVICCAADCHTEGYVLGNIFSYDTIEEIEKRLDWAMKNNSECVECHAKKIDAWLTKYEEWNGNLI